MSSMRGKDGCRCNANVNVDSSGAVSRLRGITRAGGKNVESGGMTLTDGWLARSEDKWTTRTGKLSMDEPMCIYIMLKI